MNRRHFLALAPAALVTGCGFQLRRAAGIPFASLYLDAPAGSQVAQRLRNMLASSKTLRLAETAGQAEATLKLGAETRGKTILSLSGAGRVTEYRLSFQLTYSINGRDGRVLGEPETIDLSRELTYDDSQVLAKDAEEQLLYRDMEESATQRILRRLRNLKPGNGPA